MRSSLGSRIAKLYLRLAVFGHRTVLVAAVETLLIGFAFLSALVLRLEAWPPLPMIAAGVLLLVPLRLAILHRYNLVRGWWRYTGFREAYDIAKATLLGTLIFFFVHELILRIAHLDRFAWPFSVYLAEGAMTGVLLLGARGASRLLAEIAVSRERTPRRVVLVGAGSGARILIRELQREDHGYGVVACVDDDERKLGIRIEGVVVEGTVDELPEVAARFGAEEVWLAVPSAKPAEINRFVSLCQRTRLPFKTLPRLSDIVCGDFVAQVREVDPTDLLERTPVVQNLEAVASHIRHRVVMVTGAAGSIGSELCAQLLSYQPAVLVCVDQSETGMFYLEIKQRAQAGRARVVYRVADVCNTARIESILREFGVEVIFHAAAYKHVPVMESNVQEAVYNNVLSLVGLLERAEKAGVKAFVMISSDKAVNPTNVMGTTKRVGELIVASRPRAAMACVAVRFGNVLGSNGSVLPVLQQQIRADGEITITHPEIKRYFMTINEAVSLVLQAYTVGKHGDILVLDMGEPVRIVDMARNLIRLSGKTEQDVKIRFIGLRDGEKLKEELFYESEQVESTSCPQVLRTRSHILPWHELSKLLAELALVNEDGSANEIKAMLKRIVPEYVVQVTPLPVRVTPAAATRGINDPTPPRGLPAISDKTLIN
jgi:FlaA1/EpsC-like NDP-sugar epimerase